MSERSTVRLGTRASQLARTQSGLVAAELAALGLDARLVPMSSEGDESSAPLASLGTTGVFATRLRQALEAGECELLVHSFKDLPVVPWPGLRVAAVPARADARDALCARDGLRLAELPTGARVGTGSPRRVAALRRARGDLEFVELRGNVDTRLAAVGTRCDAVVLAAAGLARLDRLDAVTEFLEPEVLLPAPAQGALAIEVRDDAPAELLDALARLDDRGAHLEALAERAVLAELEAGCQAPIGARARLDGARLHLAARVVAPDGAALAEVAAELELGREASAERAAAGAFGHELGARLGEAIAADPALRELLT